MTDSAAETAAVAPVACSSRRRLMEEDMCTLPVVKESGYVQCVAPGADPVAELRSAPFGPSRSRRACERPHHWMILAAAPGVSIPDTTSVVPVSSDQSPGPGE
ncbi:hypothetical protein SANTM175S_00025 [Streptomyces antimycoticus]